MSRRNLFIKDRLEFPHEISIDYFSYGKSNLITKHNGLVVFIKKNISYIFNSKTRLTFKK